MSFSIPIDSNTPKVSSPFKSKASSIKGQSMVLDNEAYSEGEKFDESFSALPGENSNFFGESKTNHSRSGSFYKK